MGDPRGFLTTARALPARRPVDLRIMDWREVYADEERTVLRRQAGRCMDCGIPFCHHGCPLGNLVPEWNDLVHRDEWQAAADRLHATNNFPEFTGRLCPAPCEAACVLGIDPATTSGAVTIKAVEVAIADRGLQEGWVRPLPPERLSGRTVAVVGSGPAGLAAAQQLTRAGHTVVVLERADAVGGLLRYGIPEFKMEKRHLDARLAQMRAEGTRFRTGVDVGVDPTGEALRASFDAVVVAVGATAWRDLPVPGRELGGVLQAMEYLPHGNRAATDPGHVAPLDAAGRDVVVIGGGDTGADCVGTAHRQGARSVTQLEIMPEPPGERAASTPWPTWPLLQRTSSAHEEGGARRYAIGTQRFLGDDQGRVRALEVVDVALVDGRPTPLPGSERELPADLVLLALGFTGPERSPLLDQLGVTAGPGGALLRDDDYAAPGAPGVFVAGDAGRGQSLVVWAIAEGRSCAAAVDAHLTGRASDLPAPVPASARPLRA